MTVDMGTVKQFILAGCAGDNELDFWHRIEEKHVQVGANEKTAWFFVHNWGLVFVKVKWHHGHTSVEIKDKARFQQIFPWDAKNELKNLGVQLIMMRRGQH